MFSDIELLRTLTSCERRPNLLVDCTDRTAAGIVEHLKTMCASPFHHCRLPGTLDLPASGCHTLVLHDVGRMTLTQQLAMFDWLQRRGRGIQVVSLTEEPLIDKVRDGSFLEGLFYRLNTISLTATGAPR
jgi:hypothetical protein